MVRAVAAAPPAVSLPSLDDVLGDAGPLLAASPVEAPAREGRLPIDADDLLEEPSGNLFALSPERRDGRLARRRRAARRS